MKVLKVNLMESTSGNAIYRSACGLHNGGIDGFSSQLAYYPDSKLTVIVLPNVRARSVAAIAAELAVLATANHHRSVTLSAGSAEAASHSYS